MSDQNKILIVDDDPDIVEFLQYNLKKENFIVETANNGLKAIEVGLRFNPHLILLDVMMPEMDGIETCQELRKIDKFSQTFITMLTARSEDYSQIAGFNAGADDYVIKPIKPKVLIGRIKACLNRYKSHTEVEQLAEPTTECPNLIISKEKYTVHCNGEEVFLPRKEFELLAYISSRPNRLFTRDEIFNHIWGSDTIVGDRTMDVYIRKIRSKIGDGYIKTVKGVGYKFIPE